MGFHNSLLMQGWMNFRDDKLCGILRPELFVCDMI